MKHLNYFECNLPKVIPSYYHPEIYAKLTECVARVYARTEKLNAACYRMADEGMRPATFHQLAKMVFDSSADRFDAMSVDELCTVTGLLYNGTEAPDRIEWPNVIVFYDTAFVSTKDWESLRHFGIGGSDSSVVMGVSPYQSEEGLYYDKVGFPEKVVDPGRQAIFDRGHFLEPKVIEVFCRMTGAVQIPETRMFQSKTHPHSTANLDGVLRMPTGNLAIFEAKSAVDCFAKAEEWFGSNIPPNYLTQIHQYLGVMNDPRLEGVYIGMLPCTDHTLAGTYIGSEYDTGRYFHQFEARDEMYEEDILCAEDDFWADYVEAGIAPVPSKNAEIDKTVMTRYRTTPVSDPEVAPVVISYENFEDLYNRLIASEEQVTAMTKELENLKNFRDTMRNELIAAMQGAQEATLTDNAGTPRFIIKNTLEFLRCP